MNNFPAHEDHARGVVVSLRKKSAEIHRSQRVAPAIFTCTTDDVLYGTDNDGAPAIRMCVKIWDVLLLVTSFFEAYYFGEATTRSKQQTSKCLLLKSFDMS